MLKEVRYNTWNGLNNIFSDIYENKFGDLLYLTSKRSRLPLGPTYSPIQTVPKDVYLRINHPEIDADHSLHLAPILRIRGVTFEFPNMPSLAQL
jgi:hypothetical protein